MILGRVTMEFGIKNKGSLLFPKSIRETEFPIRGEKKKLLVTIDTVSMPT